jgi:hypothetical protein
MDGSKAPTVGEDIQNAPLRGDHIGSISGSKILSRPKKDRPKVALLKVEIERR